MRSFNIFVILVLVLKSTPSPSAPPFEMAKLGKSATLTCQGKCSGSARWVMTRTGRTVAQCNQTACHPEEGFNISHAPYLKGDLSLTITAADYIKRTWYTCQCDGEDVCRVYLRIERVDYSRQLEHGDSFTVDVFISERVKIMYNVTDDDGSQKTVTVYESSENKVRYHPDYEKRALSKSSFILNDVRDSDSRVYTVWDADNDEIIATYTLTVTDKRFWRYVNTILQGPHSLFIGIGLGILLSVPFSYVYPLILKGWTWLRSRVEHSGSDERTSEKQGDPTENLQLVPV